MRQQVVSVNIGGIKPLEADPAKRTGIVKLPVSGPQHLGVLGFDGDGQANRTVHGGPHMAAYLYSADDHAHWEATLGTRLRHGTFGENITVTGFPDHEVVAGDVLQLGGAVVQVTIPRLPCATLSAHMGDPGFAERFAAAARLGFYVRVLQEGPVEAGDGVERLERGPVPAATIAELGRVRLHGARDLPALHAIAAAADVLHPRWNAWIADRIAALA